MPVGRFLEWLGFTAALEAPKEGKATFLLKHGSAVIGTLDVRDGMWTFEYSDEFKTLGKMRPIVEFPDVNTPYSSKELWQFFASRIPSPAQPAIEEILKREHIEEDDAIGLLRRFGRQTVANPFRLEAVA